MSWTKPPKGRGAPILYLDFDGVLHHENCLWHPRRGAYLQALPGHKLFQHVELLENMLMPYPNVLIVLSTSWVLRYGFSGAAKRLSPNLRSRVIGATYHSSMPKDLFADMQRGVQVTNEVLRRRPGSWLALDDNQEGWPAWSFPNVLFSHPVLGINDACVKSAFAEKLASLAELKLPFAAPDRAGGASEGQQRGD